MLWLTKSKFYRSMLRIPAICFACLSLVMVFTAVPALATGKKPSSKNCSELGDTPIKCYTCDTKQYKGLVSVQGQFDATSNDCFLRYKEARDKCSRAYEISPYNVYMIMRYKLGTTDHTSKYPNSCD